jgi:CheY-like chemotaxis protein
MAERKAPKEGKPSAKPSSETRLQVGKRLDSGVMGAVRRARVLVVDDEPRLAQIVAFLLERDHDVRFATDPRTVLSWIEDGDRFDLILSDVMMPGLTGLELHQAICEVAPDQGERMVFMSGNAFRGDITAYLRGVQNPLLEKPFDEEALIAFVAMHLQNQKR